MKIRFWEMGGGGKNVTKGSAPSIYYRKAGEKAWIYERCGDISRNQDIITASFRSFTLLIREIQQDGAVLLSAELKNDSQWDMEVARVQYFDGSLSGSYGLLLPSPSMGRKYIKTGDQFPSCYETTVSGWKNCGNYLEMLDDPVYMTENCAQAQDLAVLINEEARMDITLGFVGPGTSFGETAFFADSGSIMAGPVLDGIILKHGADRTLETLAVLPGNWQHSIRIWAELCKCHMKGGDCEKRKRDDRITGFCSWYGSFDKITSEELDAAASEYEGWSKEFPVLLQLDDGFQKMCGEWEPNEKFEKAWKGYPERLSARHCIPGLWLAPTAVNEGSEAAKKLAHCIQRNETGEPSVRASNWNWCLKGKDRQYPEGTWFLDPSCPEVLEWIKGMICDVVTQGWKYLKIDFVYILSTSRVFNKEETSFESFRKVFAAIREAAGEDIMINSCTGALSRYALGYVESTRLGGDTVGGFHCMKENIWNYLVGLCTGTWWQCDPDVFYMRSSGTELASVEREMLTRTIGETGGCFYSSDHPSQWSEKETSIVAEYWDQREIPVKQEVQMILRDYEVAALVVKRDKSERVLVYNWSDNSTDVRIHRGELEEAGCTEIRGNFTAEGSYCCDGEGITVCDMPAHSVTVVKKSGQ